MKKTIDGETYWLHPDKECYQCVAGDDSEAALCCALGDECIEVGAWLEAPCQPLKVFWVTITKQGVVKVEAEDAEHAEQIARDQEADACFDMDIQVEVEEV
jgi:hypothetical protein